MPTFDYEVLPDLSDFASKEAAHVRELAGEYKKQRSRWGECKSEYWQVNGALGEAQERDQKARAQALRASKGDPGKRHEEKTREKLAEVEDEMNVLEVVIADVGRDLSGAITEAKDALIQEARKKREDASRRYTEVHRELREAHDEFKLYDGLVRWAHTPTPYFATASPDMHVLSLPAVLEDNDPEKPSEATEVISSESASGLLRERSVELSRDEIHEILEAREARQRDRQEKGARELAEILTTPHSGMSQRYTLEMPEAESNAESNAESEQE